jgi:KDO2-lipid IV(A) lauroyltransferase
VLTFYTAATVLAVLRWLPRSLARSFGAMLAGLVFRLAPGWRSYSETNLRLALPGLTTAERAQILQSAIWHWGWQLAEFARFPRYTKENIGQVIEYDGLENYQQAVAQGKGVLYLTAHLGAWELSSFAHSANGYPLAYLNRPIDNPPIDRLVNRYRQLHGNRPIDRRNAARAVLEQLRSGGAVGILMDQNVHEGDANVFADLFGIPASTTSGLARFALKTGAAVVPVFALWDEPKRKYRLRFEPALELGRTGDDTRDIQENTELFNKVIEKFVRRYPDQWLWAHRRWGTRPPGEPSLYSE